MEGASHLGVVVGFDMMGGMFVAQSILLLAALYGCVGLLVGVWFVLHGVTHVDHASHGASWGFRILILPGSAALWPMVLMWSVRARRRADQA